MFGGQLAGAPELRVGGREVGLGVEVERDERVLLFDLAHVIEARRRVQVVAALHQQPLELLGHLAARDERSLHLRARTSVQ